MAQRGIQEPLRLQDGLVASGGTGFAVLSHDGRTSLVLVGV